MMWPLICVPKSAQHTPMIHRNFAVMTKAPCSQPYRALARLTKLHDIPVLEYGFVLCIWRPVGCHVIQGAARWKCYACLKSILCYELPHCIFKLLTQLCHCNARLGYPSYVGPHLQQQYAVALELPQQYL